MRHRINLTVLIFSTLQIGFLFFYKKSICLKVLIPLKGVLKRVPLL